MLELLYDKYCAPFEVSRVTLFYTLVWLKHYSYQPWHLPKIVIFAAKHHVKQGLQHLSSVMTEVSMQHGHMTRDTAGIISPGPGYLPLSLGHVAIHQTCRLIRAVINEINESINETTFPRRFQCA